MVDLVKGICQTNVFGKQFCYCGCTCIKSAKMLLFFPFINEYILLVIVRKNLSITGHTNNL